ncbi:hypothetical protein D9M68_1003050 [compost metagenome]
MFSSAITRMRSCTSSVLVRAGSSLGVGCSGAVGCNDSGMKGSFQSFQNSTRLRSVPGTRASSASASSECAASMSITT